jgi:hypothetical protein
MLGRMTLACRANSNPSIPGIRTREAHEGEDIGFGVVHEGGELGETRADVGDMPPGGGTGGSILLGEDSADRCGEPAVLALRQSC